MSTHLRTLYPEIAPRLRHSFDVGDGHVLKVQEFGRRDGLPVVFLHGGPGAGCERFHARYFDPQVYRIVLFDQRGCGGSTPHAELRANTTWHLVADIEEIRRRLGVEQWVVFGGSCGSTLGLAYAERHRERVLGLVLRGIFLCRDEDLAWFYRTGTRRVFPEYWEEFLAPIPEAERGDLIRAYHARLTGGDELARMGAAKAWSIWEGRCATLRPNPDVVNHFANPFVALSLARVECHYFVNDCFLEAGQLLRDASALAGIPGTIVHGRYDLICPVDQAQALARAWPDAELRVVADAGHSALEPGILDALVRATDAMPGRIERAQAR